MSRAQGILNRVNGALRRTFPQDRTVYKRVVTRSGGDDLIGRGVAVSTVDTLLDPQPTYQRLGRNIVGDHVDAESVLGAAGSKVEVADDYSCLFSSTALPLADLNNKNVTIVFKDSAGNEEIFRITDYTPVSFQGTALIYMAFLRSTKRP